MGMAQPSFSLLRYTTLALNVPEVMSKRTELFIWSSHEFPGRASLLVTIKDIDEDCGMPKGTEGKGGGAEGGGNILHSLAMAHSWEELYISYFQGQTIES